MWCMTLVLSLWRHRGFLKSDGSAISHAPLVCALLDAILLTSSIAVCKCAAHTTSTDPVSRGNAHADSAAKRAACEAPLMTLLSHSSPTTPVASLFDLSSFVTPSDVKLWISAGASKINGIWHGPDSKPCLPCALFPTYAKLSHGRDHVSKGGMCAMVQSCWFTKGFSAFAADFCHKCMICAQHNPGKKNHLLKMLHTHSQRLPSST